MKKSIPTILAGILGLLFMLITACQTTQPASRKAEPKKTIEADTTSADSTSAKSNEKEEDKKTLYEKIVSKAEQTEKGLMNLYKVKKKLYLEIPFTLLGREMLLGSTISETSDNDFGALGAQPHPPLHLTFGRVDSTILLRKIERNSITPEQPQFERLQNALAKNSMGAIIKKWDIEAYNDDHSSALIEVSNYFSRDNKNLSPFNKDGMNLPSGVDYSTRFKSGRSFLGEFKAFEDNISIKSHLSYEYDLKSNSGNTVREEQPFTALMTRTFLLLPEKPMQPRIGDSRIGIATIQKYEYDNPLNKAENIHFARRFRLVPKDIEAYQQGTLVEATDPITFYVDKDFPEQWKEAIKQGIEDWNETFEEIGFKNAIQAKEYPQSDPQFDPDNIKYSVVRYVPNTAQRITGSSWIDPRSGEVLNGSIYIYHDLVKRIAHQRFVQTGATDPEVRSRHIPKEYIQDDIRYHVRRQVGFRLGFKPNGAASASIDVDSLRSPTFTQKFGTTYSTLDNARYNYVAQPGDKKRGVQLTSKPFGPYDFYVTKWNYQYFPSDKYSQMEVRDTLNKFVDEKADDIKYRYALPGFNIKDPTIQGNDLGDNAVEATKYGLKNLKYILQNLNKWISTEDKDFSYRQALWKTIIQQYVQYLNNTGQYVGGIYSNPIYEGDPRPRFQSVPSEKQRQAYMFLLNQIQQLDWMMDDNIIQNFELTEDISALLREKMVQLLMKGPLMVYMSSELSEEPHPYTPALAMQDLYESVWSKTMKSQPLGDVDIALQKAFVGTTIETSELPVEDMKAASTVNLSSGRSFTGQRKNMIDDRIVLAELLQNKPSVATTLEYRQNESSGMVSASYNGGQIHFPVGPSIDLISYKYLLKVQTLLQNKVEQMPDAETKAHYQLLLHQLKKVL
ncbi:zinc-dependent metalloprotease [Fodinibius salsisoli]|uniref:Zinc-dependent metalloprotease n=1 Tax=Fodinibius salsisoli TaxID=2820877 RepID=A0ABT3PLR2_9BACT|nr:zinc-dependent metalloprotease [Fodinibius salsisoli]MCW9706896.1 zinc-dependent metalloprotease [Fodinibius salsisoli]